MRRKCLTASIAALIAIGLTTVPASALNLTWANGSKNLNLTSTAVCTLIVRPTSTVGTLPPVWRLVYVGDSTCPADSALVFLNSPGPSSAAPSCAVNAPVSAADVAAHQTTVMFCGPDEGEPTSSAAFVLRIDPSLSARIAAVDASPGYPGASDAIDASAEVTINGGVSRPYPAVVWAARQTRDAGGATHLAIQGIGLDRVRSLRVQPGSPSPATALRSRHATHSASNDTLSISSQSSNVITAQVSDPLAPGQTLVLAGGPDSAATTVELSPEQATAALSTNIPPMFPDPAYYPKDFAFIYDGAQFHIFYIRHRIGAGQDFTENDFGHAVWSPATGWSQLAPVLPIRPSNWDNLHVWAPSIIWDSPTNTYYMFYTGVTNVSFPYNWYQRIGLATSRDLLNWSRYDAPVFSGNQAQSVYADSSNFAGCQFRDPFVMPDPTTTAGQNWLMFYAATPQGPTSQLITHAARNARGLTPWQTVMPMWNTDFFDNAQHYVGFTESPHVFTNGGRWYLFYTSNAKHRISFEYAGSPVADSTSWSVQTRLFTVMGSDTTTDHWYASEFLQVPNHQYFAFVNDLINGIEIREMTWTGPASFTLSTPSVLGVPSAAALPTKLALAVRGNGLAGATVEITLELPERMNAGVAVYDLLGRRIMTLRSGLTSGGVTALSWDKRDGSGSAVGPGVYFVRLVTAAGSRSAKVAVLR